MSNYHEYRKVKVLIAEQLMQLNGWNVYGYKADESDHMIDYSDPADWDGIAEKNGYVLCVDVYGKSDKREIREYNRSNNFDYSTNYEKIKKLEAVTVERGATISEEETAKEKIRVLTSKNMQSEEKYIVTGYIPAHLANPPRCNWHIEKDGIIIAKGNGILKFSTLRHYYDEQETLESIKEGLKKYCNTIEELEESAAYRYGQILEKRKIKAGFNKLINKFDKTCGCLVGEGDIEQYETITTTEYKKENKIVESKTGSIKEGQCFILKSNFNYGKRKGLVYRIHEEEHNGKKYYHACKLNKKLTKECTGQSSTNNHWRYLSENFLKWIESGAIEWCKIQEVKTPYEVEKVVKKSELKSKPNNTHKESTQEDISTNKLNLDYFIEESRHTKNDHPIWLVKINTSLTKKQFADIKKKFAVLKGYYSSFTHSFIFKYDPVEKLQEVS